MRLFYLSFCLMTYVVRVLENYVFLHIFIYLFIYLFFFFYGNHRFCDQIFLPMALLVDEVE